jgi:hypothetical protein
MSFDLSWMISAQNAASRAAIERHPTRGDLAADEFECPDCGAVKTQTLFENT